MKWMCKKVYSINYICAETSPINYLTNDDCLTGLLHFVTHKYPVTCQLLEKYMSLSKTLWILMSQTNERLYVTTDHDEIAIVCDDEQKAMYPRGKIFLQHYCKGMTSVGMIYSTQLMSSL